MTNMLLRFFPETIPAYLTNCRQWVVWRYEDRNGKQTKPPFQVNGEYAKTNDSTTWSDFPTVKEAAASGRFNGVGFCFSRGDQLTGIDLDACVDDSGVVDDWAQEVLNKFPQHYIEMSPSGRGFHVLVGGKPVQTGSRKWKKPGSDEETGIEIYDYSSARYFCVTGDVMGGAVIRPASAGSLEWLYDRFWAESHSEPKRARNREGEVDTELVKRALGFISSDEYRTWICVGMAVKAAGLDFAVWDEWSSKSDKYSPEACKEKWATFNGTKVGLGTVFFYAKQHGFKFPDDRYDGRASEGTVAVVPVWPKLDKAALVGGIGDFVKKATEGSEADPAAVLYNLLPFLGCVIGRGTYVEIGDERHSPRLFTLTIGATGRGRKGTAAAPVKKLSKSLMPPLAVNLVPGPLSSGEGLINAVRDASEKVDDEGNPVDPGVVDKRLFILSSEFASALTAFRREGNILATVLRAAWDGDDLNPLTKNNPIKSTNSHICFASHITREELLKKVDDHEIYSGTMNRILLGCVRRSKQIPNPKPLDEAWFKEFVENISGRLKRAQGCGAVCMTKAAEDIWNGIYPALTADESGIIGALIGRSEAQAKRIALEYALLDDWQDRPMIDVQHLKAALAIIQFSNDSARFIFGSSQAHHERDKLSQLIVKAVTAAPNGLSQTELQDKLKRNFPGDKLWTALSHLQSVGRLTQRSVETKGRTKTVWILSDGFSSDIDIDETNENDEESAP